MTPFGGVVVVTTELDDGAIVDEVVDGVGVGDVQLDKHKQLMVPTRSKLAHRGGACRIIFDKSLLANHRFDLCMVLSPTVCQSLSTLRAFEFVRF